jgi:hypothetical protein
MNKLWVFLLLDSIASGAATLEVGSGKTYATITLALAAASFGDTVSVYDGTYSESPTVSLTGVTVAAASGNAPWIIGRVVVAQSNVTVRGLGIGGWTTANAGGVHVSGYDGLTVENCSLTNAGSATGSGIYTRDAANILIRSNVITGNATGVNVNSGVGTAYENGVRILANLIATNYFDGLDLHGRYITVEGNTIFRNYDTNWVATHPDGIQLIDSTIDGQQGCQEVKIVRNTIYSHPQNIFTGYWMTNILIANNVFYQEAGTVNGVDLDAITTKHCGLYSGAGFTVANNYFGRAANSGVYVSYDAAQATGGITVKNNIFADSLTGYIAVYFVNSSDIAAWDYNLYSDVTYAGRIASTYYATAAAIAAATAHEDNGVDADPDLDGYVPRAGSPAVGAGADLSEFFTDDFTGSTRVAPWDIGAYEYLGRSATAGTVNVGTLTITP